VVDWLVDLTAGWRLVGWLVRTGPVRLLGSANEMSNPNYFARCLPFGSTRMVNAESFGSKKSNAITFTPKKTTRESNTNSRHDDFQRELKPGLFGANEHRDEQRDEIWPHKSTAKHNANFWIVRGS
jgi:hypothetical protein